MRPFDLHEPETVEEAVALLERHENSAPMGGGAILTFLLRERLAAPDHVVSLTSIRGLDGIECGPDGLQIGATATLRSIERSATVRQRFLVVSEAAGLVGNVRVRNVSTLGGHLAQGDIHQDLPPVLVALGALVSVQGPGGSRRLALQDFLRGYYETALGPGEVVTGLSAPLSELTGVYMKYCSLSQHDWPAVGVCAMLRARDGRAEDVRVVAGGVSDRPLRVPEAETLLQGERPAGPVIAEIARRYAAEADPVDDAMGSAEYKREMAAVFVRRALGEAARRAGLGR